MAENLSYSVGDRYRDFEVVRVVDLHEIQSLLIELVHRPTGAKVMHFAHDDEENVFCLLFQTIPDSSNGVAHILEHIVLCGSEKFPIKDPFFCMGRRSLNTFMNAMTGSDFTCYPAASQIPKDFYNLLDVYLDAVFKPYLKKLSFLQEGWRLEFADPSDPMSLLEYKGVVFNEMKGGMATPDRRLSEAFDKMMFPALTYGYNLGGDPKEIPQLTYQELLTFHQKFYHPSRCLFLFYGNMPLEGHLDFIESNALQGVEKAELLPPFPKQPRFAQAKKGTVCYPSSQGEGAADQSLMSLGWLTCHILEQEDVLALNILSIVLLGTDAAPLKKALLKSGLCKQVSVDVDDECSEVPFVITLRGCRAENADELEKIVKTTLENVVESGIPEHLVEGALHQIEFHRSEITGDGYPYGLALFLRAGLLAQHGGNPENSLVIHSLCRKLQKHIEHDSAYLTRLIERYFLHNPHFVRLVAIPDTELAAREREEERQRLDRIQRELSLQEQKDLVAQAQELARFQGEEENLELLPKLALVDVPKNAKDFPLIKEKIRDFEVFSHQCFTNDIVYADVIFSMPRIEEEELPLVSLFSLFLPQMGCGGRSYAENLDYILAHTGGVDVSPSLNIQVADYRQFHPYLSVHGKALGRKIDKLFTLLYEMITSTDFTDVSRIKEVIIKHFTALQMTLNQNALKYAMTLSASGLDMASRIAYAWNGLAYYHAVEEIVKDFDRFSHRLVEGLQSLQERMLCLKNPHLVITCDTKRYDQLKQQGFYGLLEIPAKSCQPWESNDFSIPKVSSQGRLISSPVAFTAQMFKTLPYIHPDTPALSIAEQLFDHLVLHPRIREQGGAYGGGAKHFSASGNFCFYAYRDPHIAQTFSAFNEAIEKIVQGDFDDSNLEEAKLEVVQKLDLPVAPGSRGSVAYTWYRMGKTYNLRQAFRDSLLALTREEVIETVKKHLAPNYHNAAAVVFAGEGLLQEENRLLATQGKRILPMTTI